MTEYIKLGPLVAIAAALGFAGTTGYVLFEDIFQHSAPFTTKHIMTLAVLGGAAYFGDRIVPNWRRGCYITAVGCLILAIAGSAFCLLLSTGRITSVTTAKNAEVRKANGDRKDLEDALEQAKTERSKAADQLERAIQGREDAQRTAQICQAPAGKAECKGVTKRSLRDTIATAAKAEGDADVRKQRADTAYFQAQAKLQNTPAQQVENADLQGSANLFSAIGLGEKTTIEALLAMLVPFGQSLFCEIGFLVSVANARGYMGHGSVPVETKSTETDPPTRRRKPINRRAVETQKLIGSNVVRLPVEAKAKAETLAFVLGEIRAGRSFPSQDALAARAGVVKSTISKWAREWEAAGHIRRTRIGGRHKVIGAAVSS
jgi:hypothetical protein